MANQSNWRKTKNTILTVFSLLLILFTAYSVLISSGIRFGRSHWSLIFVILIDAYWIWVLIDAARFSREDSLPANRSAFPKRLVGLFLFFACFSFEICAFGLSYFDIREEFKNSAKELLPSIENAFFMSFGTMTTIDIVDYSPTTDWAKSLKSFQVVSNLLMLFAIFPVLLARLSTFKDAPPNEYSVKKRDKLREYNKDFAEKGCSFVASTIEELTGITPDMFCMMSGLFSNKDFTVSRQKIEFSGTYPNLLMVYKDDDVQMNLQLLFNINDKSVLVRKLSLPQFIQNKDHEVYKTLKHLAKKTGFSNLILQIVKDDLTSPDFNRWAGYFENDGVRPTSKADQSKTYQLGLMG